MEGIRIMEIISVEYGVAKTFDLPFVTYGATDFLPGVTLATGDVKISKDNGAFVNIATLPTINGAWMEITLSATETEASRIKIQVIDLTATKVFEDTGAILSTVVQGWFQSLATSIQGWFQDLSTEIEGWVQDILDKIDEKLNVYIVASGGSSQAAYAEKGAKSKIFQGDVILIPRYLEGDLTGNRLFFGARKKASDADYTIGTIECTNLTYDSVNDRTAYTIPFVAADTKTVKAGTYLSDTEVRDPDGISNPVTGDRFDLVVINEIVR